MASLLGEAIASDSASAYQASFVSLIERALASAREGINFSFTVSIDEPSVTSDLFSVTFGYNLFKATVKLIADYDRGIKRRAATPKTDEDQ
jgi:hypothetical protein